MMSISAAVVENQNSASLPPEWMQNSIQLLERELSARHGDARVQRGLRQVAEFWRAEDGDAAAFEQFVRASFIADQPTLDVMFTRFQHLIEQLSGHMHEIHREFRQQLDLDLGPVLPFDEIFGGYDPAAHISDDFFRNKLAFAVLLNFPLTALEERVQQGATWNRRQWAEARLAQSFDTRLPADVRLAIAQAEAESGHYISEYNLWMHHILDPQGTRLFPSHLRLQSHWGLRDEIMADYDDAQTGLAKQRVIQRVMERIITQTIPAVVVNNRGVDWNPFTNQVTPTTAKDFAAPATAINQAAEPNTRYAMLFKTFDAARKADPYSPTARTLIDRRFNQDREISEARVKSMLEQVLTSPLVPRVAELIKSRLGRPLEPFDIWYTRFRPGSKYTEAQLDEIVAKRYPTAESYEKDIPHLLTRLGFTPGRAQYLAGKISVDPARGSGHAMGAEMRTEKAHLRTRVEKGGMNYHSFNVAAHEMGHNVEQILSLNDVDHHLLRGVPNTAFTEAFAFFFQARALELLDLAMPDGNTEALKVLNEFWITYEIAGVSLVDIAVWHWMYDNPSASPQQLNDATLQISKDIWNRYYAPVFHHNDVVLLGVYSHMIDAFLYLPDYPVGKMIAQQIEAQIKDAQRNQTGTIGSEVERMVKMGRVSPDLWMLHATGRPVGPEALLEATERALTTINPPR